MHQSGSADAAVTLTLGAPVRGENMFGREREIEELRQRLRRSHVLLLAPRRVGKTSLMLWLLDHPDQDEEVIFLDVEALKRPEQFIVALGEELGKRERFSRVIKSIPGLDTLKDWLKRVKSIDVAGVGKVEVEQPPPEDWRDLGQRIFDLLGEQIKTQSKKENPTHLLIIIDEFPYFIRRMASAEDLGTAAVEDFLTWFRSLRQEPAFTEQIHYLLGGSIGLGGVLGRIRLSALVNDIYSFPLAGFSPEVAGRFLLALERGELFPLSEVERLEFLRALRYLLPYYIQLLFAEMKHLQGSAPAQKDRVEAAMNSLLGARGKDLKPMVERLADAFPDPEELRISKLVLQRACQGHDGISRAEADQLVAHHFPNLSDADERLLTVLDTLEHDGYLVHTPGADDRPGQYQFQSELLRRWWKRRYPLAE